MTHKYFNTFDDWRDHKLSNEMTATLTSDVLIYFYIPSLRSKTYNFTLWGDRFLQNKILLSNFITNDEKLKQIKEISNEQLLKDDPELFIKVISDIKLKPFKENIPNDQLDLLELDNKSYEERSVEWCTLWKDTYKRMEDRLTQFQEEIAKIELSESINKNELKLKALESYRDWLYKQDNDPSSTISIFVPFRDKAVAWAIQYKKVKEEEQKIREILKKQFDNSE